MISIQFLTENYEKIKENRLFGKWITLSDIEPLLEDLPNTITKEQIGVSEEGRAIHKLKFGTGKKRILIWSQMHGNESTGTKAMFDLIQFLRIFHEHTIVETIYKSCTIEYIPILNPDGALAYTRLNAKNIDLNRDVVDQKACESQILRKTLQNFNPQFCFNLHDQRTIFGVEGTKNPATISFLAPSEEETRKITPGRIETMDVIVAMNELIQQEIPNYVGRYTDEFYPTATGDNFQKWGHNTILIEAGHYPNDYNREITRRYNFYAILQGLIHISITEEFNNYEPYFQIPNNVKSFFDVIHRNKKEGDVGYLYVDEIKDNLLTSRLKKEKEGDLKMYNGHHEIVFED
jgi:hypothetical protein